MLGLHPIVRSAAAGIVVSAILVAQSLTSVLTIYFVLLVAVWISNLIVSHAKFLVVSLPLLLALLVVWDWAASSSQVPAGHASGLNYAIYSWLRILAFGATLQCLFLPLLTQSGQLSYFLHRIGLPHWLGTVIVSSSIFLPEVQRRMGRILEARKAQGHKMSGVSGVVAIPTVLMPLMSSLIDSAAKRGELWAHRRVLDLKPTYETNTNHSYFVDGLVAGPAIILLLVTVLA